MDIDLLSYPLRDYSHCNLYTVYNYYFLVCKVLDLYDFFTTSSYNQRTSIKKINEHRLMLNIVPIESNPIVLPWFDVPNDWSKLAQDARN